MGLGGGNQQLLVTIFKGLNIWTKNETNQAVGGRMGESFIERTLSAAKQMNLKAAQWGMMNKFLQLETVNRNLFYNAHNYSFKIYKMLLSLALFNVTPVMLF